MNVKKIKEFVKEHKGEIAMGCLVAVAGVAGGMFCKKVAIPKVEADCSDAEKRLKESVEALTTICGLWDLASEGADGAVAIAGDELARTMGDTLVYTSEDGVKLKLTGAILFGNEVET